MIPTIHPEKSLIPIRKQPDRMDHLYRTGLGRGLNSNLNVISLSRDQTYTLGHGTDQEIQIMDDMISLKHAVLRYYDKSWTIEDKQSLNKTFVNGKELIPHQALPLLNGNVLRLGVVVEHEARDFKFELFVNGLASALASSRILPTSKSLAPKEFHVEEIDLRNENNNKKATSFT